MSLLAPPLEDGQAIDLSIGECEDGLGNILSARDGFEIGGHQVGDFHPAPP